MKNQVRPDGGNAKGPSAIASSEAAAETQASFDGDGLRDGERRTVTVLFADMKGFTSLSERLDPEVMDNLMTRVFGRFEAVVRAFGGSVEKYIGDAMVAVFGYPALHEDDPARAVETALSFAEVFEPGIGDLADLDLPAGIGPIRFRVGIHSGVVATGKRGGQEVVTGHSMAIAARLEATAPAGGILVSEIVKERCGGRFLFGERQELFVKGKEEAVEAYRVLGRSPEGFAWETPFVGRERELQTLLTTYLSSMREGTGGVYVLGEAGIGKTRLCAEFRSRLSTLPSWESPFVVMNPARTGRYPWAAATGILLSLLGPEEQPREGTKTGGTLRDLAARLGVPSADEADLATLVWREGAGLSQPRIAGLLAGVLERRLAPGAGGWPAVLIVDNVGAIDDESTAFFRGFLASSERRIFVILIDRLGEESLALAFRSAAKLQVESLDDGSAAELVRSVDPSAPEKSVSLIVRRSQGNPLCLEEFAKLLRKNRDREPDDIPDSVQNAILASTEDLPADRRRLLRGLSVLERPFNATDAARLLELANAPFEGEMGRALELLEAGRFLAREAEDRYRFRHSIIREAIHGSLLNHNKHVLNAAAARLYRERQPGWKTDIFRHLVRGALREEAADYLITERPALAVEEAGLIQEIIDGVPPDRLPRLVELHFLKFAVYWNNDRLDGVDPLVASVGDLALRARDRHSLARVNQIYMNMFARRFDFASAVHFGRRAVALHRESGDGRAENSSRAQLAWCLATTGDFAGAAEVLGDMARGPKDMGNYYLFDGRLGMAMLEGDYRAARKWGGELAELNRRNHPEAAESTNAFLGALGLLDFDFGTALAWRESCDRACLEPELLLELHAARALAFHRLGRKEESAASLAAARESLAQLAAKQGTDIKAAALARVELALGDLTAARLHAEARLPGAMGRADWVAAFELSACVAEAAREQARRGEAPAEDFSFFIEEAAFHAAHAIVKKRGVEARFLYLSCLPSALAPVGSGPAIIDPEGVAARLDRAFALLDTELADLDGEDRKRTLLETSVLGELAALRAGRHRP